MNPSSPDVELTSALLLVETPTTPLDRARERVLRARDEYAAEWALEEQLLAICPASTHGLPVHLPGCNHARSSQLVWVRPFDLAVRARHEPELSCSCLATTPAAALGLVAASWTAEAALLVQLSELREQLDSAHVSDRAFAICEILSDHGRSQASPLTPPSSCVGDERVRLREEVGRRLAALEPARRIAVLAALVPGASWAEHCQSIELLLRGAPLTVAEERAAQAPLVTALCAPGTGPQGRLARVCLEVLASEGELAALAVPAGMWEQFVPAALRCGDEALRRRGAEQRGWIELDEVVPSEVLQVALPLLAADEDRLSRASLETYLATARNCLSV